MDNVKDKIFGFNQKFHNHADSKGIGLYLVYNHIISLGGRIEIESKINEGAKFIISFKDDRKEFRMSEFQFRIFVYCYSN